MYTGTWNCEFYFLVLRTAFMLSLKNVFALPSTILFVIYNHDCSKNPKQPSVPQIDPGYAWHRLQKKTTTKKQKKGLKENELPCITQQRWLLQVLRIVSWKMKIAIIR